MNKCPNFWASFHVYLQWFSSFRTFKFSFASTITWEKGVPNNRVHKPALVSLLIKPEESISNSHRGNFDIIADILDASHSGAGKTNLMYRCNLSFKQLKGYSRFLLGNGLLRLNGQARENETVMFEVTEKGREFLKAYKGLKALMK